MNSDITPLVGARPSLRTIVWKDERNAANYADLLSFARTGTERQVDRMLRLMPIFPDAPEIVIRPRAPWMQERRIVCPNEHLLIEELRRLDPGLAGHKEASRFEKNRPKTPVCQTCSTNTCGPDMTAIVVKAIDATKAAYAGWKYHNKERASGACEALDSWYPEVDGLPVGAISWDILPFYDKAWLYEYYRYGCAGQACHETVQIERQCHYAGSVNYVIFGVMCKLCDFTADKMLRLIWAYKGDRRRQKSLAERLVSQSGVLLWGAHGANKAIETWDQFRKYSASPADNYEASRQWALAGYVGWPHTKGVNPPPGDRSRCKAECGQPYPPPGKLNDAAYRVAVSWSWVDHSDKTAAVRGGRIWIDGQP